MKKYVPYIALTIVLVAGGIFYAVSAQKENTPNITDKGGHSGMGHDSSGQPIAQSHRSYDVQVTSDTSKIKPGQATKITYKIINDKKEVLKDFTVAHEKLMHFILIRKDLQHFQHLHPDFNQQTGEFSVNVAFPADGPYRLFPDFTPAPENMQKLPVTVRHDVNVGDLSKYKAEAVVADKDIAKSSGGFTISHYLPETRKSQTQFDYNLVVEEPSALVILEPYLGAMGHGVILKEGTLDFIHTHAEGMDIKAMEGMSGEGHAGHIGGEPDKIDFSTNFPEPGIYKIFTQFQVKGKVVTTDYTVKID